MVDRRTAVVARDRLRLREDRHDEIVISLALAYAFQERRCRARRAQSPCSASWSEAAGQTVVLTHA